MNALAEFTISAHGGLDRWNKYESVSAHLVQGGVLWAVKGQPDTLSETNVTVGTRDEWASHSPFGENGYKSRFAPSRVALETAQGEPLSELRDPRASFLNHTLETPWSSLQLAYFAGYAMWTYLNAPFLLARDGVVLEEISSWSEQGETWRRLEVSFPKEIATHSSNQTLYIDDRGLLKRHDYDVEISGGTPGAHYMSDYTEVSGIKFPTRRRVFARQPDGSFSPEPLVVSIDLSDNALK